MLNKILLLDPQGQTLYEFPIEEMDKAYDKAKELEEMGIEVELRAPSLPETLGNTLGMKEEDRNKLRLEIEEEIDSHNHPTCIEK